MKIGYLGPKGTFSEQAGLTYIKNNDEGILYTTITDLILASYKNEIDMAVCPIENSIEGTVTTTLDTIIFDTKLFIQSEIIMPISHNLLCKDKSVKHTKIASHIQALAQCRNFIYNNYKNLEIIETVSTASAAKLAAEDNSIIAISNLYCSELYNLEILDKEIEDRKYNVTRFVALSKNDTTKPKENTKASVCFSAGNTPGDLHRLLHIFSLWDINMTKIESRPVKNKLGEYVFFVDLENYNCDDLDDCLKMINRKTKFFKNFGCYYSTDMTK